MLNHKSQKGSLVGCGECGHLTSKHDNSGCVVGSCDCTKTPDEIAGVNAYPALPEGVRFTKRGYVKKYNAPADEVFGKALSVINDIGSFVGYELLGKTYLKGLSRPFAEKSLRPVSYNIVGWESPDTTFEVEVEVNSEDTAQGKLSEFILRIHHPYGTTKPAGTLFSDLTGAKAVRIFYHRHATAFILKMDSIAYTPQIWSQEISPKNHDPTFRHESMRKRYRCATMRRQILLIASIAIVIFIVLRYFL